MHADPQWPRRFLRPHAAHPLRLLLQENPQGGEERRAAHQQPRRSRQRLGHRGQISIGLQQQQARRRQVILVRPAAEILALNILIS